MTSSEASSTPLAQFLIDRNKQLEEELEDVRTIERENEKLEESTRYLRGLLTNYVELDKSNVGLFSQLTNDIHKQKQVTAFMLLVLLAFGALSCVLSMYQLYMFDMYLSDLIQTIIRPIMIGWAYYSVKQVQAESNSMRRLIEVREEENEKVKRSNHLFPELFPD